MARSRSPNKPDRPPEPPCYSCVFAIKRGHFRLCNGSGKGYKHIGIWEYCEYYQPEDMQSEKQDEQRKSSS